MARQNDDALYPHGKLFIRRKPGSPLLWQVLEGSVSGFGKTRVFTPGTILEDDVPKGRIARELAEKHGSGPQLSAKERKGLEASPIQLTQEATGGEENLEGEIRSSGEYEREARENFLRRRRAAGGNDDE